MARARNIKPGLYKNEDLAECSIWARFLFPGLWMLADREGRLEDRPKRIKGELLPFDSQDVEPLLRELAAHQFLVRYQIDGVSYIQISKFKDHQAPHYSEKKSVIKPPATPEIDMSITVKNSGKEGVIKAVSQPPDSLIPDSLIPDSPKKSTVRQLPDYPPGFVSFWASWPKSERKQGKGKCFDIWKRRNLEASADWIVAHVAHLAQSDSWKTGYDPMPETYLNGKRWDGADLDAPRGIDYSNLNVTDGV